MMSSKSKRNRIVDDIVVITDSEEDEIPQKKQRIGTGSIQDNSFIISDDEDKSEIKSDLESLPDHIITYSDDDVEDIAKGSQENHHLEFNLTSDEEDDNDDERDKDILLTSDDEQEEMNRDTTMTVDLISEDDDDDDVRPVVDKKSERKRKKSVGNAHFSKKRVKHEETNNDTKEDVINLNWKDHELLSQQMDIKPEICKNIFKLFHEGNTIPFISRYRKNATENMSPDVLREVKKSYDKICYMKEKIVKVVKNLDKSGLLTPQLRRSIAAVQSVQELEVLNAQLKTKNKKTLFERAKLLGLEPPAMKIFRGKEKVNLNDYVEPKREGLDNLENVKKGVVNIIAQYITTDSDILYVIRKIRKKGPFYLHSKKSKSTATNQAGRPEEFKFKYYFDFKRPVKVLQPHQVMAINRGEHYKILSVKIIIPEWFRTSIRNACNRKWFSDNSDEERFEIFSEAYEDAYSRIIQPLIVKEVRAELKSEAEKASYQIFNQNLQKLLLAPPLKGRSILAIDPGYKNGCKIALVSQVGSLLTHDVIYPHGKHFQRQEAGERLKQFLLKYDCSLIALGNGKGCRETEEWLTELITTKYFAPLDVRYTIVSEQGASIYSCSPEAKKEFPQLDVNVISAVSIARRLQDPLGELVKIEPKHLGVGMYQHDLKKKVLEETLNDVVSECVSFVGVDLNTASHSLLRRVAGLTDKRATQIIQYRETKGPFLCRKDLMKVFGIGNAIFQQCAGFLRVGPLKPDEIGNFYRQPNTTKLDCTYIHPESYKIAEKIIKKFGFKNDDLGEEKFIKYFKSIKDNYENLSEEFKSNIETIKLILETFSKPLNYDLRSEVSEIPMFSKEFKTIQDLKVDTIVKGQVRNVTNFGCFVDIGIGRDGLIHKSQMNGFDLELNDRVEVVVTQIDMDKGRTWLKLLKKFN